MPSGKILYFVRPEEKRRRTETGAQPSQNPALSSDDDEIIRRQFHDLLKGIWPAPRSRPV